MTHARSLKAMTSIMNPQGVKVPIFKGVVMPYKRKKVIKNVKPRKHDEQDLSSRIEKRLNFLELQGFVIHHDRYNCGIAQRGGHWIRLCKDGTSDRAIFLPNRLVLFIEIKSLGKKPKKNQREFMEKMIRAGHKYFYVDSWEYWNAIENEWIPNQYI